MKALYFSLLAALLIILTAQADPRLWGPDGIPVRQGTRLQDPVSAEDVAGNVLYVWADMPNGSFDIRAQLVSPQGTALWTPGGITVCGDPVTQQYPTACRVGDGWIIAWIDFRSDSAGDVWAQKLNYAGVAQWAANGIIVDQYPQSAVLEASVRIAPDGQDGAYVAWEDHRFDASDILAQHLTGSGATVWTQPLVVCGASGWQDGLAAEADGAGGLLLAWTDKRNGAHDDIYAAKLTPDGLTPWGTNGLAICTAANDQLFVRLCPDGDGGGYFAWEDQRGGPSPDLFMQRVNSAGQIQFATGGISLCSANGYQDHIRLAPSWNGATIDGVLACWQDLRANGLVREVYAQKVSPVGVALWGENGLKLCGDANPDPENPSGTTRQQPELVSDHAGGLVCAWEDARFTDGATYDLYAVRVLAAGTLSWGGLGGTLVSDGPGHQGSAQVRFITGAGIGIGYEDYRTGSNNLCLQTLDLTTGNRLLAPEGVILVSCIGGYSTNPHVVAMSNGRTGVVWVDIRTAVPMLFYQIFTATGSVERAANGDKLVPDNEGYSRITQENPKLASDGSGGFFIAYEDIRTGRQRIRLQRVDAAGELACTAAARMVFSDSLTTDQMDAYIAPDGDGGCYIAWSNLNGSFIPDVFVMCLDANCQPAAGWNEPVRLSQTLPEEESAKGIVAVEGGCLVVWRCGSFPEYDLDGAIVRADGTIAWQDIICDAAHTQDSPVLAPDGSGGAFVVWEDTRSVARSSDLYAQRLNADGEELWPHNGAVVISDTLPQSGPRIATDTHGNLLVVWEDYRNGSDLDLYLQKLTPAGAPLWEPQGRLLCGEEHEQRDVVLGADGADGWFVAWTDRRTVGDDHYWLHVFGLHLTVDGVPAADPFWVDGGSSLVNPLLPREEPSMVIDGGEAVVVYRTVTYDGYEPLWDLAAQRIHLVTLGADDRPAPLPVKFALHAAYPNPFNPTTTIAFDLPVTANIKLVVFDLLGREVVVLENARLAAGSYQRHFDASALASGVYFYRLEAGSFAQTHKLVLLK